MHRSCVTGFFACLFVFLLSRIAQTTAALTRLKPVRNDRSISLSSKIRLTHSLVTSIFLYACESWTLTAELQRRIHAMEMRCYCQILRILYKDHVTNEEVCAKIHQAVRPQEDLTNIKRHKLQWYGHVPFIGSCKNHLARHSERGKKTRQAGEEVGGQHQEMHRPGVCQVQESSGEQRKMEETGCKFICGAPTTLAVNGQVKVKKVVKAGTRGF